MNLSKVLFGLTTCFFAASLSGCFFGNSSPPPPSFGSISVDVTIEESNSPSACSFAAADQIEVTLIDAAGNVVTTVSTPCETFGMTIDNLPEGRYEAEVLLLDVFGHAVSDILVFADADVIGDTELQINADFPSSTLH